MPSSPLASRRLIIGFLQGVLIYLVLEASEKGIWPANQLELTAALITALIFAPLVLVAGLGNIRPRTLLIWAVVAASVCMGVAAYYAIQWPPSAPGRSMVFSFGTGGSFWIPLAAAGFITHALIAAGDAERRVIASYPRYFDVSWKQGVQGVLGGAFIGAFWALLWLGAGLFGLIKITLLREIITSMWFAIPVTTAAVAYAIHVTDVRAALVVGARTLKLTLLSWLLPLIVALTVVFLLALFATGLEPLWETKRATFILLATAAATVFLVNAVYQDGQPETHVPPVLAVARFVGALVLAPLVALAAYGLMLRINQYGFTPERVLALACVIVAACYAIGYAFAAVRSGLPLKYLETTNVAAAWAVVAIILALLSPVADPIRISVNDQVARLKSGRVAPDAFDYAFLRFNSGPYGRAAMNRLATDTSAPAIAAAAEKALKPPSQAALRDQQARVAPEVIAANITVVSPPGGALPVSFAAQDWTDRSTGLDAPMPSPRREVRGAPRRSG